MSSDEHLDDLAHDRIDTHALYRALCEYRGRSSTTAMLRAAIWQPTLIVAADRRHANRLWRTLDCIAPDRRPEVVTLSDLPQELIYEHRPLLVDTEAIIAALRDAVDELVRLRRRVTHLRAEILRLRRRLGEPDRKDTDD